MTNFVRNSGSVLGLARGNDLVIINNEAEYLGLGAIIAVITGDKLYHDQELVVLSEEGELNEPFTHINTLSELNIAEVAETEGSVIALSGADLMKFATELSPAEEAPVDAKKGANKR